MKRKLLVRVGLAASAIVGLLVAWFVVEALWARAQAPTLAARASQGDRGIDPDVVLGSKRVDQLLRVEDPGFYGHHGVDVWTKGSGYTTITQALAKRLYYEDFEPGILRWRKVQQTAIAVGIDSAISKADQLRLFVNLVYLGTVDGREVIGFGQASEQYYGTTVGDLSDDEYLSLVAMIVGPDGYSVRYHPAENAARVARIKQMLEGRCGPSSVSDVYYEDCDQR